MLERPNLAKEATVSTQIGLQPDPASGRGSDRDRGSVDPGRQSEARPLLAEIYGWFTEGFDASLS
jgi:hypothetical protein